MRINRTQDVGSAPKWAVTSSYIEELEKNQKILEAGVERINITASSQVSEISLCQECTQIEKCASSKSNYYYNNTWKDEHVSHLREYSIACGLSLDNFVGVDPTTAIETQASSDQMVKTASTHESVVESGLKDALGDPFKIEARTDMSYMEKANWEVIGKQANLDCNPKEGMLGGIVPVRGGEDVRISNTPSLPKNQNSIYNPDAISEFSKEADESRLNIEVEAHRRSHKASEYNSQLDQNKIEEMEGSEFKAAGVVFPTEVLNAGSGVSSNTMGAYSDYDLQNLPEKTQGEMISEANKERKSSIQRESQTDASWGELKAAPSRMVSDTFTDELKKRLS